MVILCTECSMDMFEEKAHLSDVLYYELPSFQILGGE